MEEKTLKQASCETNVLYMMSLAMDLILRNNEWLMSRLRQSFRKDKKQLFTRYAKTVRDACYLQDLLTQDIFDADEKNDYRNIQIWQDEANELSRLVLLFADRSADQGVVDEQPGEGIVTEEMLESFYLKK